MIQEDNRIGLIDVDKVLKQRKLSLPTHLVTYLKKIIHQEELNDFIGRVGNVHGFDFLVECLSFIRMRYELRGIENVPVNRRYVFASNHPFGGADGIIFMHAIGAYFPNFRMVVNDLIQSVKNLDPLVIGVNKHGLTARESIRLFDATFASDAQVLVFPAGLISRKTNGTVTDLEWKKTFLTKAIHYKRDIVPIHISGKVSNFFYAFSNIRKRLRIKTNLEMVYLVNETFKLRGQSVIVTCGKPIPYTTFDKRRGPEEWAQEIRNFVYRLSGNPDADFKMR